MTQTTAKTLSVPFVPSLGAGTTPEDLLSTLEREGTRFYVNEVNWPGRFPYCPLCGGEAAYGEEGIGFHFHVRGLDLRVANLSDNAREWEDSCCEVFLLGKDGRTYFNFETNAAGKVLSAMGEDRHSRQARDKEGMGRIIRYSSLGEVTEEIMRSDAVFVWDIAIFIPFELLGFGKGEVPPSLKGNLYKCADLSSHPHYVSWSPVGTPGPDFHRPEFFGTFILAGR